ncbi:hemolysin [Elizabethkingia anophelis]|uniref:hemolysin n=1 Tax=Elizabethkingia anophelis TaxID=1117645 RepID=UPI0020B7731B|nr:hemolysin [Elizabethkingia anophelis]UTG59823.1 hemolysin [Elizabethkingia anophelis]UXM66005.1 hemolysin [Elizabethkingia anophelis]
MKKKHLLFLLGISIGLCSISCNRDENGRFTKGNDLKGKTGRFDNKPFSWDVQTKQTQNDIFLGDLNVGVNTLNMSASNGNLGTANGNIFINSANVYPGVVFPKPSIDNYAFDAEIRYDKNPYDLNFMFPIPYTIEDIDNPKGLSNYNKKISEALNSTNFTNYINSGYTKEVDYSATEVYNYEDVKKAFSFNTKLGGLFSTKMTENKHNQKYNSIYFARLVSTSFDVIFDQNRDGFFKSGDINNDLQNAGSNSSGGGRNGFGSSTPSTLSQYFASGEPYFIKQMSYGKFAYLAIESEYSYSEVKRTIEATFDAWKISGKAEYSEEIKRVLSKSTVTVFSTGDSGVESYWGTSLDNLYSMFKVKYNSNFYGYPVYTQIRSVKDDKLYTPPTILYNGDRGNSNGGSSRPDNGFKPNPNPDTNPGSGFENGGRR